MPTQENTKVHIRVLENIDRAVIALDNDGIITLFNPAAQAMTGLSERQALGKSFNVLFKGQSPLLKLVATALAAGRSVSNHEDITLYRPLSQPLPASVSVSPLLTESGSCDGAILILRDLSRLQDLEQAMRQSERLSQLGTLAAGLAHEIKNPLGGIKGAAQLLDLELPKESPLREYTAVMIRETERVNTIIEGLLELTRDRQPKWAGVNLGKILGDILLLQKTVYGEKQIDFLLDLDPSIPEFRGDEALLTQLFLNLIKNAAEAISDSGFVRISSKIVADYHLSLPGGRPAPFVTVEIRDNGTGIAREDLERIFTPFYTTKHLGSGLGLPLCQKIVRQHDGMLKAASEPGSGTVFSVSLPLIPPPGSGLGE
ncbi:two-component system sensor histidine kinase NtrB [Trichloromonas sp.]|uniref:two-component system sensor histidine kinase NtrB n=1 Tax=Trichloromonas sp. TaxID=3069249 RepID=UPI002A3A9082|nr:ATP-binding protein [Trichloromonas sp.]